MKTMPIYHPCASALSAVLLILAGCAEQPGEITRDTKPFDGISPTASISVRGNEPFWSVSVEPSQDGYDASLTFPDRWEDKTVPVKRFAGNNGLGFSGELDGSGMSLALTPGQCSDTMSDQTYPYSATLLVGDRTLFGCAYTSDEPVTGDQAPR